MRKPKLTSIKKPKEASVTTVYSFIRCFFEENDCFPTIELIRQEFGLASSSTAFAWMATLQEAGLIERNALRTKYRFTRDVARGVQGDVQGEVSHA